MAHWAWDIKFSTAKISKTYKDKLRNRDITGFLSHLEQAAILYTTAERLLILELKTLSLRRFGFFAVLLMLALVLMRTVLLVKLAFRLQGSPSRTTSAPREKWERDEESGYLRHGTACHCSFSSDTGRTGWMVISIRLFFFFFSSCYFNSDKGTWATRISNSAKYYRQH